MSPNPRSRNREAAGFKQQMKMVGNKRSSETSGFCFGQDFIKSR